MSDKPMLIVTGNGFSGTVFMAHLFDIKHEPRPRMDAEAYLRAWYNKEFSKEYIKRVFKGDERESNPFLVPHTEAIRGLFPEATIFHLVRCPRKVVRSQISGGQYSDDGIDYHNIKLFEKGWDELTQFEKVCWWWRTVNQKLRKEELPYIRIEDMNGEPRNVKPKKFPHWENWGSDLRETFNKICGPELIHYGYKKFRQ